MDLRGHQYRPVRALWVNEIIPKQWDCKELGRDADGSNSGNSHKEKVEEEEHLKVIQGRTLKSRAFEGHVEKNPDKGWR